MSHIDGVEIPENYNSLNDDDLKVLDRQLVAIKRGKIREMDYIDTELVGIREVLRKRKEEQSAERNFPGLSTQD